MQKVGCALSTASIRKTKNQVQQEQCCVEIFAIVSLHEISCTQISQKVCSNLKTEASCAEKTVSCKKFNLLNLYNSRMLKSCSVTNYNYYLHKSVKISQMRTAEIFCEMNIDPAKLVDHTRLFHLQAANI